MNTLDQLQQATLVARQRTGDSAIGTSVKAGRLNIVRVTFPNGPRRAAAVEVLAGNLTTQGAIDALNKL